MDFTKFGRCSGIAIFAYLCIVLASGQTQSSSWSGYYIDNGTHYLLYQGPRLKDQTFFPGNISTNPAINALEALDYLPTRIVNGKRIKCSRAPYQCSLHFDNNFICGCVILSRRWILTAQHCKVGRAGRYTVRAGSSQQRRGGQLRHVQKTVIHRGYSEKTMRNDLCMMKLKSPLKLGRCVQRAKLPSRKTRRFPKCCLASGWGLTSSNAQNVQRYLRGVVVCIVNRRKCQQDYSQAGIRIYRKMICAKRKNRDTCSGDSGGPLVHGGILYGVTSFGVGCGNVNYPGVYVNVLQFVKWIKEVVRNN
ncbi:trypsin alpha-3-like [Drosophila biarmipes]|uniref:trypsin alpha-3-like n=1 Tax=Drosophila biarmipes TaxID=125945 RepID=UPI0021CCC151|nr:trypsin alpha-3-like [Drosophila biarmipes]